jgi:hypothetical protein
LNVAHPDRRAASTINAELKQNLESFFMRAMPNDQLTDGGPSGALGLSTAAAGPPFGAAHGWDFTLTIMYLTTHERTENIATPQTQSVARARPSSIVGKGRGRTSVALQP